MKKFLLITFTLFHISGCASKGSMLSDDGYKTFPTHFIVFEQCYNLGYLEPELYSSVRSEIRWILNTWRYDKNRLNESYHSINELVVNYIKSASPEQLSSDCREYMPLAIEYRDKRSHRLLLESQRAGATKVTVENNTNVWQKLVY